MVQPSVGLADSMPRSWLDRSPEVYEIGSFGAGEGIRFEILGPLRVYLGTKEITVTARRERTLLAVLLVRANRAVSSDQLIDAIWPIKIPQDARNQLQHCVMRLRRRLVGAGADRTTIATDHGGYRIAVESGRLDAEVFRRLVAEARAASVPGHAEVTYRSALALWRGPALADFDSPVLREAAAVLDEEHAQAIEECLEHELSLGKARELLPELRELTQRQPFREKLHGAYILTLYRAGRYADALDAYQNVRRLLRDELGAEPGRELRDLHRAILNRDPGLDASPPSAPLAPIPRELPADIVDFTGRADALRALDEMLPDGRKPAGPVVISAIAGTAGVGKTALAVHWAHRVADQFPDGQLFLDLHGFTEAVPPVEPADALDRLLRALGVPGERIPAEVEDRAGLWRSILAGRRMLIVLDNAASEAQVAPLLPGTPGCLAVITSRRRLAGLEAAVPMPLDVLPLADAVALFTRAAGEQCLANDAEELVVETVQLCGRLPLAIRIAAARLRAHPTWRVGHLVERLRDQQHRLGELEAGQRSVTAALDLSYRHLSPEQQQAYRLLGLHPGAEFDAYAVAALLDSNLIHAGRVLDQLLESHLLREPMPGRYRFHDLTRAHAAHTVTVNQTTSTSDVALSRLLDSYLHTASVAVDAAYPYEREHRSQVPPARTPNPELPDQAAALAWLDTELPNLLAAARLAADRGRLEYVLHLSTILHSHLRIRGPYHDAETLYQQALVAASAVGDEAGRLSALNRLGGVHWMQGRYALATDHFAQALQVARTIGKRPAELDALRGLGDIHWRQGRYALATEHFEQALEVARATGNRPAELNALSGLGHLYRVQGQYQRAADYFEQALHVTRAAGHRIGELDALNGLGWIRRLQGRYEKASDHYRQLLELAHDNGDLNWLFEAWQGLGRLRHATGDPDAAIAHHERALAIAGELNQPEDEARAHNGLAHAHYALNKHEQARTHWKYAPRDPRQPRHRQHRR